MALESSPKDSSKPNFVLLAKPSSWTRDVGPSSASGAELSSTSARLRLFTGFANSVTLEMTLAASDSVIFSVV
jgi:hypothetical protein